MSITLRYMGFGIVLALYFYTRLVNLDLTLPFSYDEATDLVRMEEIFDQRKVTLIGPISTNNTKVFSSLTYYMYLPFAIMGDFDIASPAWGAVFWGLITSMVLLLMVMGRNTRLAWVAAVLLLSWAPLVISQRHAYNPNLVPFWMALAVWLTLKKKQWAYVLSGVAVALAVHQHYLAGVAGGVFLAIISFELWTAGKKKPAVLPWIGLGLGILPLILYDLTHLPGVFLVRSFLVPEASEIGFSLATVGPQLVSGMRSMFTVLAGSEAWAGVVLGGTILLALLDWKNNKYYSRWLMIVLAQGAVGLLTPNDYVPRYALAAVVFYFIWLFEKRLKRARRAQLLLIGLLMIGSWWQLPMILTQPSTNPPVVVMRHVGTIMNEICKNPRFKNGNVTTIKSPDADLLAMKYRWYLSRFGCTFKAESEYDTSENIVVITTGSTMDIRADASATIAPFKNAALKGEYDLGLYPWRLVWLGFE
jgi:hypothetical protein